MKNKKSKYSRIYVELTAIWGNDDVSSSIKISRRRWAAIHEGAEFQKSATNNKVYASNVLQIPL